MNTGNTVWWAQFVTPGATILGILIGFGLNWARDARAERQRWKREDQLRAEQQGREDQLRAEAQRREDVVRYNERRIEAYAALMEATSALALQGRPLRKDNKQAALDNLIVRVMRTHAIVELLASPPVREVAGKVVARAFVIPDVTDEDIEAFSQRVWELEQLFFETVREELGVLPAR